MWHNRLSHLVGALLLSLWVENGPWCQACFFLLLPSFNALCYYSALHNRHVRQLIHFLLATASYIMENSNFPCHSSPSRKDWLCLAVPKPSSAEMLLSPCLPAVFVCRRFFKTGLCALLNSLRTVLIISPTYGDRFELYFTCSAFYFLTALKSLHPKWHQCEQYSLHCLYWRMSISFLLAHLLSSTTEMAFTTEKLK